MNPFSRNTRLFVALLITVAASPGATSEEMKARLRAQYGKLPLSFQENRGQAESPVKYLTQGRGYSIWLTPGAVSFQVQQAAIQMNFAGAQAAPEITARDRQQALSSYFMGNDPAKWLTGIPNYARVRYSGLYPGVDLVLYGSQGQLEYDFVVAPGADPQAIQLAFRGVDSMRIDAAGDLVLTTTAGEMRQHKPVVYQEIGGARKTIDGRYVLEGRQVRFALARYDTHAPLIIDPILSYLTYLGSPGQAGFDPVFGTYPAIALDSGGDAYVVTTTTTGNTNVQVNKLNSTGTALLYNVNFGGSLADIGEAIAVDGPGDAYVTGVTSSTNFPVTAGAPQPTNHSTTGGNNAFVVKLNPTGGLVYSTYLGGTGDDFGRGIAIDSSGNAYVAGTAIESSGTNFPITSGVLSSSPGPGFLTKVNNTGTSFEYSTFLSYGIAYAVAVGSSGNAFVTGTTGPSGGLGPAYVVNVNSTASALAYGPIDMGDSAHQSVGYAIALDSGQNAYVTGMTSDPAFKVQGVSTNGPQTRFGGGSYDAFAVKLNATGGAVYSTYIGGIGTNTYPERGTGIGVDGAGDAYVGGTTECIGFPQVSQISSAQGTRAPLSMSTNHGANWSAVTGLMPPMNGTFDQVTALAFGPSGSNTIYAGTSAVNNGGVGGGIFKSTNNGSTWTLADTGIGNAASTIDAVAVDPSNSLNVYAVANGRIYQTTNGGSNWAAVGPTVGTSGSVAIGGNSTVYVGSSTALVVGNNGTWTTVSTVPLPVNTVAVNPLNAAEAYAGTNSGVYFTTNSGVSWVPANTGLSGTSLIITSLTVDSLGDVYAATPAGVVEWKAGTGTWTTALPTNTVQTTSLVAVDPSNPMDLYVGLAGGGIVYSTNGGMSFSSVTLNGLTHNTVLSLAVQPGTGTVFAGNTVATDAFVVEIASSGSSFVFATCIGGADNDLGQGLAVNSAGSTYLSGATASANLPVTAGVYQSSLLDTYDAFVAALDVVAAIIYPEPDTVLSESSFNFSWNAVSGATEYQLTVGTTPGGSNIFSQTTTGTSLKVSGLPCTGGTVYVQLSTQVNGTFEPANSYTYHMTASCTGIGDFNGDGHQDMVWQNSATRQVTVNYYGGSSPLAQGYAYLNSAGVPGWHVVGAADFDHNGTPDLVWQNDTTRQVTVNYYSGSTYIGWANLNNGVPGWTVVAVADQNSDGNPDLIWQNDSTRQVSVNYYGGSGGAVYQGWNWLNSTGEPSGWTVVADADFDHNGTPDLVWEYLPTGQVSVNYYGGAGGAVYQSWAWLNSTGDSGWTVVGAIDYNGDGAPDLIWENNTTNQVTVNFYGGTGGTTYEGWNYINSVGYTGWMVRAVADFDGNGEPDLVWQNDSTRQVTVNYYGFGGVTYMGWNNLNNGVAGWSVVGTGDFDGNGVPDLVWQNNTTRQVTVNYYGGPGGATYLGWANLNNGVPGWTVVAVADQNGDGVPDLIWQNDSTKQITVNYYGGTGGAVYQGWAYLNSVGDPGWTVVGAADFDRNGTPDLVWQNLTTGQVTVNYFGGTGGSTYQGFAYLNSTGIPGWTAVGASDFDGNGVPDLVWENNSTGQLKVYYYGGSNGATNIGWNWLNETGNAGWHAIVPRAR